MSPGSIGSIMDTNAGGSCVSDPRVITSTIIGIMKGLHSESGKNKII